MLLGVDGHRVPVEGFEMVENWIWMKDTSNNMIMHDCYRDNLATDNDWDYKENDNGNSPRSLCVESEL